MHFQPISEVCRITGVALLVAIIAGCSTAPPTIDTSPDAEVTFDGLHEVQNSRADKAWARPGVDLSQYSKIMIAGAGIEYRPGGESGRSFYSRSSGGHFEVTEEQKQRLRRYMAEAFLEELGKSERFTIVDERGSDVLLINGALLDVVSYVPEEPIGNSEIYLSRVGEATLVLEIRDSVTDAIFARAVDRRAAESGAMEFTRSNRVTNRAEVRRVAKYWARRLREILEGQMEPAE